MENENIEISFKNWYLFLLFLGGIIFVIGGIYVIIISFFNDKLLPQETYQLILSDPYLRILYNSIIQRIIGIISIIFFGFTTIIIFRKIFGKKPGLIIDGTGIIDNSTGFSAKHIKWTNIIGVKSFNMIIVKFITVIINNPEEYFKRYKLGRLDYKLTGSPINIYTNVLKCKHKELVNILQNELNIRK